jgi:hypothetical protein
MQVYLILCNKPIPGTFWNYLYQYTVNEDTFNTGILG